MLSIDLNDTRRSQIVNAGHLVPMLQRGGAPPVGLELHAGHPFGVPFPEPLAVQDLPLAPGDRITPCTPTGW